MIPSTFWQYIGSSKLLSRTNKAKIDFFNNLKRLHEFYGGLFTKRCKIKIIIKYHIFAWLHFINLISKDYNYCKISNINSWEQSSFISNIIYYMIYSLSLFIFIFIFVHTLLYIFFIILFFIIFLCILAF